jgi:hypothetical protein
MMTFTSFQKTLRGEADRNAVQALLRQIKRSHDMMISSTTSGDELLDAILEECKFICAALLMVVFV